MDKTGKDDNLQILYDRRNSGDSEHSKVTSKHGNFVKKITPRDSSDQRDGLSLKSRLSASKRNQGMIKYIDSQVNDIYANFTDKISTLQSHFLEHNKELSEAINSTMHKIQQTESDLLEKQIAGHKSLDDKLSLAKQEILMQKSADIVEALNKVNSFKSKFSDLLKRVVTLETKVEYFKAQSVSRELQKRVYGLIETQNKLNDTNRKM